MMEKLNKQTLKRFFQLIRPERPIFFGLILCSLVGNALVIAMPFIMGIAIDDLLTLIKTYGIGHITFPMVQDALLIPVLILIVFSIISSLMSYIQERVMAALSERITLRVRKEVTKKFKSLPMAFLINIKLGIFLAEQRPV